MHDWPTALLPVYLNTLEAQGPFARSASVLTIHNLAHQGIFPKEMLPSLGLGWDQFSIDGIEFYGGINLLKQGIVSADMVTTVSATLTRT